MRRTACLLLAGACSSSPIRDSAATETTSTGITSGTTTSSSTGFGSPTATSLTTTSTTSTSAASETAFISEPDAGTPAIACSLFAQDCIRGEKCNLSSSDGRSWDRTRCVPVDAVPDGVDEPCSIEGSTYSGLDSCDAGLFCWAAAPATEGRCTPYCSGPADDPDCADPERWCNHESGGGLGFCLDPCTPLAPEACPGGQGCYPNVLFFTCAPDASGDGGGAFESCASATGCDPGLFCANPEVVGMCDPGASGCCTPLCDPSMPSCPIGTECLPLEGEAVGLCGQEPA